MSAVLGIVAGILAVLLWIAVAALGLALLVLLLPLDVRVRAAVRDGEPSGAASAAWAFGLVGVVVSLAGLRLRIAGAPVWRLSWRKLRGRGERGEDAARARKEREERKARASERREERRQRRDARRERRDQAAGKERPHEAARAQEGEARGKLRALLDHRRTLLRMLARFARALHLRLRVNGTIGLDDPAHTAALAGALAQLAHVPGVELEVELDWLEEALDGEAEGSARVWVPELLAVAAALWIRRANRVAVRALAS